MIYSNRPIQGVGIGLRPQHYSQLLSEIKPPISWLEVLADNFFCERALPMFHLEQARQHWPMTLHCIGMSLGGTDPLDYNYLAKVKKLQKVIEPRWISDHLCWTHHAGRYVPDLLPVPYTPEVVSHVASRIEAVQSYLGSQILIENVSTYGAFKASTLTEVECLVAIAQKSGCGLLLDVNNIYVSTSNQNASARAYLDAIPKRLVKEIHLAGFQDRGDHLYDTHGSTIHEDVWGLYAHALKRFGCVPTLIEWDNNIPALDILCEEARKANDMHQQASRATSTVY